MDRLESMTTLLAAVDGGSLSAASRALRMPLATVSRKVSELEDHLGTRLLVRTSRRLQLTEAGSAYVAACREVMDRIEEAERQAAGEYRTPRGDLTISAPVVFGRLHVEPVVLGFLRAYPAINVRLALTDSVMHLTDEHIDLAVRIGRLPDSAMKATAVGHLRRVLCASPGYLAERGVPAVPEDLAGHDCIAFAGPVAVDIWPFAKGVTVPVRPRLTVNTAEGAIDAAIAGAGITRVLSYQPAKAVSEGALSLVLRGFEPEAIPVNLVYTPQPLLPLKLRAFLDYAAPLLRDRIAEVARVI
jgi:DNA-binding transcriptional LysR family regulator